MRAEMRDRSRPAASASSLGKSYVPSQKDVKGTSVNIVAAWATMLTGLV